MQRTPLGPHGAAWARRLALILLASIAPGALAGQTSVVMDYWAGDARAAKPISDPDRARVFARNLPPSVELGAARLDAADELAALAAWNEAQREAPGNRQAVRNGFERALPDRLDVAVGAGRLEDRSRAPESANNTPNAAAGSTTLGRQGRLWGVKVRLDSAYRLRLRLENVSLREGTRLWVAGEDGRFVGPFDGALADLRGHLWTPSVAGPSITVLVEAAAPDGGARFTVGSAAELFRLDAQSKPLLESRTEDDLACLEDARCYSPGNSFSALEEARGALGTLIYMSGGDSYVCSGALVNDTDPDSFVPLLLTANHCISSNAEASSVEVFWDNVRGSCNGRAPDLGVLPRSSGATLLVTGTAGDFTLLELDSVPGGRWFLGWNSDFAAVRAGTVLHRLSHPSGNPQVYSQTAVSGNTQAVCQGLPRSQFLYSSQLLGGTAGGSSGAPALLDNGQIVGQLYGDCGQNIDDTCNSDNLAVDGGLFHFWPQVAPFFDPDANAPADLAVNYVRAEQRSVPAGGELKVENTVQNVGGAASAPYRVRFYLSTDATLTPSDRFLGALDRAALGPGARHERLTTTTVPADLPPGEYFVGVVVDGDDGNPDNDRGRDSQRITVTSGGLPVSPAVNGAWFEPATSGQGVLVDVFPDSGQVFIAWFTFDADRPAADAVARLGEPGHRWLTGLGPFSGNRVELDLVLSSGGRFDRVTPTVDHQTGYGSATLEFQSCNAAVLSYQLPAIGRSDTIALTRLTDDSAAACERVRGLYED